MRRADAGTSQVWRVQPKTCVVAATRENRRGRTAALAALAAIVGLWALYVVVMNAFLSTSLFERVVNADPERLDVHYRRAWSVVPGRLHAEGLSIRSSDASVQWILRLDDVDFDVSLAALARRRFDVSRARGRGVTFRLRRKMPAPAATEARLAGLPPVPGFGRLPIRPPDPPGPDVWDDRAYRLFTVHLDDVVAEDVREIWIDGARVEGSLRIAGGCHLKPLRDVRVGPVDVRAAPGAKASWRGTDALAEIAGAARVAIDDFDPRGIRPEDLARRVSADLDLRLRVVDAGALPLPRAVAAHGAAEIPRLALHVRRGAVERGSGIDLSMPDADVATAGYRARAAIHATSAQDRLEIRADLDRVVVASAGGAPFGEAPHVTIVADAPRVDLARPLAHVHVRLDAPEASLPDAHVLDAYAPPDLAIRIERGSARAEVHAEAWPGARRAAARVALRADDLRVRVAKLHVTGSTRVRAEVDDLDWASRRAGRAHVEARVERAAIGDARHDRLVAVDALSADARASDVDLDDPLRALEVELALDRGRVVDRTFLSAYLPKGEDARLDPGDARFSARGDLTIADHVARGSLDASADALGFTLGRAHFGAEVRAHARVHDWAWERGDLALDEARIEATRIVARAAGREALVVRRVTVRGSSPRFSFSDPLARADLDARIERARVIDAAALDAFLPAHATFGFDAKDGRFDAELRASVTNHVARGHLTAHAHGLGVASAKLAVRGDVAVSATLDRWELRTNRAALGASRVTVANVEGRLGPERDGARDAFASVVTLTGRGDALDLANPTLAGFDFHLVVRAATLPDARALNALLPRAVRVASGRGRADADVDVSSSDRAARGQVRVDVEGAVDVRKTRLSGDFALALEVRGFDPGAEQLDVSGSRLAMRRVKTRGSAHDTRGWDGDLVVSRGVVCVGGAPGVDADLRLTADDATPIVALAIGDALPGFVVGLVRAPGLVGRARVTLGRDLLALRGVDVRGGDVALRGAYVARGDDAAGGLVVRKGPLSAGIRLGEGSGVRLFGLDGWLAGRAREADRKAKGASEAKSRGAAACP